MSEMIERKASERNAKIIAVDSNDIVRQMKEAADRGDDRVPQLVTRADLSGKEGAEGADGKASADE